MSPFRGLSCVTVGGGAGGWAMSPTAYARRAAKASERERGGPQLVNAVSQLKAQRKATFLGSSCFGSGSRSSYNKCFMTKANKSQL